VKRSKPLRSRSYIKRRSRIAPVNAKRQRKEKRRTYGEDARREWIRWLPCVGCGRTPCHNAHTVGGGGSRKADAATVVPLCPDEPGRVGCHTKYDQHKPPFHDELGREAVKLQAAFYAAKWERMGDTRPQEPAA
jgi:hypothetical protein